MLVVAIITKDPLFSQFGVPAEFEWIVGMVFAGFTSWRLYFNPLKERLIKCEIALTSVTTDMCALRNNILLIKEKILNS